MLIRLIYAVVQLARHYDTAAGLRRCLWGCMLVQLPEVSGGCLADRAGG